MASTPLFDAAVFDDAILGGVVESLTDAAVFDSAFFDGAGGGVVALVEEGYDPSIAADTNLSGDAPAPVAGGKVYEGWHYIKRAEDGGLSEATGVQWTTGRLFVNVGAAQQRHRWRFDSPQHCFYMEPHFACSAAAGIFSGSNDSGYEVRIRRNSAGVAWDVGMYRMPGTSGAEVMLSSQSGAIAASATWIEVNVDASAANAIVCKITRSNGAEIDLSVTGETSPVRGPYMGVEMTRDNTGDTLATFRAGLSAAMSSVRALVMIGGVLKVLPAGQEGQGHKPIVLVGGRFKQRAAAEGVPVLLGSAGRLRTINAATEELLV